jgi:hypothetical protein
MPVIDHLDLATKRIYLAAGVRQYHPVVDLYKELRTLRRTDESLRHFDMPLVASGNVPKGGGKFTPRLVTFRLGWRVVPEDTTHVLEVSGEQITDTGESGPACFDMTSLSATSKVIVQYEPPAAEVITVDTGGVAAADVQAGLSAQGFTAERAALLDALDAAVSSRATDAGVWDAPPGQMMMDCCRLLGLDPTFAVEHGDTYIRFPPDGSVVNIKITRDGGKWTAERL